MGLRFLCAILLFVFTTHAIRGQKKSRKESRQAKKMERYQLQKRALQDTVFFFVTSEILKPYTSNNWSGGYLNIIGKSLRIQEMDWLENPKERVRWREITELNNYRLKFDESAQSTKVYFDCIVKGQPYYFTITHGLDIPGELVIRNSRGKEVRYSGKVKK